MRKVYTIREKIKICERIQYRLTVSDKNGLLPRVIDLCCLEGIQAPTYYRWKKDLKIMKQCRNKSLRFLTRDVRRTIQRNCESERQSTPTPMPFGNSATSAEISAHHPTTTLPFIPRIVRSFHAQYFGANASQVKNVRQLPLLWDAAESPDVSSTIPPSNGRSATNDRMHGPAALFMDTSSARSSGSSTTKSRVVATQSTDGFKAFGHEARNEPLELVPADRQAEALMHTLAPSRQRKVSKGRICPMPIFHDDFGISKSKCIV